MSSEVENSYFYVFVGAPAGPDLRRAPGGPRALAEPHQGPGGAQGPGEGPGEGPVEGPGEGPGPPQGPIPAGLHQGPGEGPGPRAQGRAQGRAHQGPPGPRAPALGPKGWPNKVLNYVK